jgi:hypothetical protein
MMIIASGHFFRQGLLKQKRKWKFGCAAAKASQDALSSPTRCRRAHHRKARPRARLFGRHQFNMLSIGVMPMPPPISTTGASLRSI